MSRPRAILLAGPVFSGKSRFAEKLAAGLRAGGVAVAGFVQRGVFDPDGSKIGYDLVGLSSGAVRPLARRSEGGDGWRFDDQAFDAALGEIREGADLIVIDELGPLELEGRGHAAAIDRALSSSPAVLLVVREALADDAARRLSDRAEVTAIRFGPDREERITTEIRRVLSTTTS